MIKNQFKISMLAMLIIPLSIQSVSAASTEERLQRLERMADNPVLLQLSQRVAEQQREIQALQDEMDRLLKTHKFSIQQSTKRYAETDQRISVLEQKQKLSAQTPRPIAPIVAPVPVSPIVPTTPIQGQETTQVIEPAMAETKVVEVHPATAEENTQYQQAFALMRGSKYDESIKAFEAFLVASPTSSLASNASYWAGEGYLIRKNYEQALKSFELVLDRYPSSSKVPDALLRAADSLKSLKRTEEARVFYQKLIDTYPDTRAAKSAKKRIK
ncbi:MAG: tol-pal system protein YbgF [Pseudomonadota bacterium]|nr:tol-pal system protein YbgF [Pseudomonadota bacterium]